MKLKKLTAVGLAAVMCVMAAGCGSNGETNDKKQENTQKTQEKESGDSTEQEELVINYVSARGETDAALKTLKKIAEMYKEDHPGFEFNVESIADRANISAENKNPGIKQ